VRGEPVLADPRVIDEPARHHVPAHQALQRTQHEDATELQRERQREGAPPQEIKEGNEESDADQPPEQAVKVLEPEDAHEPIQGHARVHFLVLRSLLVLEEERLPVGRSEGRQRADDRLPLHDGKSGVREPGDAAQHHHREHQGAAGEQPARNLRACRPGGCGRRDGRSHLQKSIVSCGDGSDCAPHRTARLLTLFIA
jgi:hypothetical protein